MNADERGYFPELATAENDAPIFEPGMFEIEKETNRETSDTEVASVSF